MTANAKLRTAVQSHRARLGAFLTARHGRRAAYTTEQVRQGVAELGLDLLFLCHALARFCTRKDFEAHHATSGCQCCYDLLRDENAKLEALMSGGVVADSGELDADEPAFEADEALLP
jgi:hypothetical protein